MAQIEGSLHSLRFRHRRVLSRLRPLGLIALALAASTALAGHTRFLLRNDTLCDREERLCIRGSLLHHDLSNTLLLIGRIERSTDPGLVVLRMAGTTPGGLLAVVEFRFHVEGRYSEIVEQKMIPGYPSQTEWSISGLYYEPDTAESAKR